MSKPIQLIPVALAIDDQGQQLAFAEGVANLSEGDFIFS